MKFGIVEILTLLGSLGIFLFGMKLMSESLQKVAGDKMRNILAAMTSNRVKGIFTGFLITAVIQSSSATTVMVVSFVNAGLISLGESIGVIMGANIGTTVTAWLISILGFKVKMSAIAIPLIGLGFPLLFSKNTRRRSWGELVVGFSLIFIGLQYLKEAVPDLKNNHEVLEFLASYTQLGYFSLIIFLIVGTLLTIVIQSSSATMALTLVLCYNGVIPFEMAAAMVLGENIGTTITANLAAIVANVSAKRAALAHLIFNTFGVIWVMILFYPFLNFISWINISSGNGDPMTSVVAIPIALSLFHTIFNISNVLILAWFAPLIVKAVEKLVANKESDEEYRLQYINIGTLSTSELSIHQAKKEIIVLAERVTTMFDFVKDLFKEKNEKKFIKLAERIEKYEDISDRMEVEIANYLAKISEGHLSRTGSLRIRAMFEVIDDLESMGDSCFNLGKSIERMYAKKIHFSDEIITNLRTMFSLVDKAYQIMNQNLNMEYMDVKVELAYEIEKDINNLRNKLRKEHTINVKKGKYKYSAGIIYNEIYSNCEKLADYIINVTEAIESAQGK